jgi:uncharacterized protein (DUF927 family)
MDNLKGLKKQYGPFELRTDGVYELSEKTDDEDAPVAQFVCSWLEVIGQSRDQNSNDWGYVLAWNDPDNREHQWCVPRSSVTNDGPELVDVLANGGLKILPRMGPRLKRYICSVNPQKRFLSVSRQGWQEIKGPDSTPKRVFVTPDLVLGNGGDEEVILQQDAYNASSACVSGTPEEWRTNVANRCIRNPLLIFAVSVAFASPTLYLVGKGSGGFHLHGLSSSGKSTALNVASSVWGHPLVTWRTTDNALEDTAERHSDVLLPLDELSQLDDRKAAEVAYMLGNGEGKQRLTQAIVPQKKKTWRLLFLSTGEVTLSDHAEAAGKRAKAGTEVRMVNVDADAGAGKGIFEDLHGENLPAKFADRLKSVSDGHRGTAGPEFVEYLIKNEEPATERLDTLRKEFVASNVPSECSGEIHRVADRFGLVAAAGELATEAGITGWPAGTATQAITQCFKKWLNGRSTGSSDMEKAVEQIRGFMLANCDSRFQDVDEKITLPQTGRRVIYDRAGFRRTFANGEDQTSEYLIYPQTFKDLCQGYNATQVAQELEKRGYLRRGKNRLQVQQRIEGMGKNPIWFYAVNDSIFDGTSFGVNVEEKAA